MTAPTPERLATLVRFHSGCRPDAGCETCEVIAAMKDLEAKLDGLAVALVDMTGLFKKKKAALEESQGGLRAVMAYFDRAGEVPSETMADQMYCLAESALKASS